LIKQEAALLRQVSTSHVAGDITKRNKSIRRYLRSYASKIVAVHLAARGVKPHRRVSPKKFPEIADSIDPWIGTDEPVNFVAIEKSGGHWRPTFDFGIKNRALQIMVVRVLKIVLETGANQFLLDGGRNAAVARVLTQIEQGADWVGQLDVSDCFASVNKKAVIEFLPLPEKVVRHVIFIDHMPIRFHQVRAWFGPNDMTLEAQEEMINLLHSTEGYVGDVRAGLPQGSKVSSLIMEALLRDATREEGLPEAAVTVYADNSLVTSHSADALAKTDKVLRERFLSHPAGPLRLKSSKVHNAQSPEKFLGYEIRQTALGAVAQPSEGNLFRFEKRHDKKMIGIYEAQTLAELAERKSGAMANARSFAAAFHHWPKAKSHLEDCKAQIRSVAEKRETKLKALSKAA
jgi:hypothetical protein